MPNTQNVIDQSPKFYEADGALRAYSNRALLIAGVAVLVSVIAVIGVVVTRIQPPTVIRVLPSGEATVVGPNGSVVNAATPSVLAGIVAAEAPTAFEKEAYVRTFLDRYLNYDQHTLPKTWANALNMMTANLRRAAILDMQNHDTVGRLQDEGARSDLGLKTVEISKEDPLVYSAYGIRTLHHMVGKVEKVDQLVEAYKVRLATAERTAKNPTGLYIAEYSARQISGETKDPVFTDGGQQ
jgi:hypothetical protein